MLERLTVAGAITATGAPLHVWVARPQGEFAGRPKGAVILVQEIFGVNDHIRWVLQEQFAKAGYLALAPCFFDYIAPNVELAYTPEDTVKGRALVDALGMDQPLRAIRLVQEQFSLDLQGRKLPCAVVGFCWGGSVAYLSASRLGLPAVSYYGGRTVQFLHERPQAPVMFHFGAKDPLISQEAVAKTRAANFGAPLHVYEAGHGFNRNAHPDFDATASQLALARSLEFLDKHLRPAPIGQTVSHKQLVDDASSRVKSLTIEQARALHGQENVVFVDIRDPREVARDGSIPGALHTPRGMLEFWVDPASPYYKPVFQADKKYLFFCAAAWRSALATELVQRMGFLPDVAHIDGGFIAWRDAGLPVEKKAE
jgi:carboxymethylenebutenolidase